MYSFILYLTSSEASSKTTAIIFAQPLMAQTPLNSGVSYALGMSSDEALPTDPDLSAPVGVGSPSANGHMMDSFGQDNDQNGRDSARSQQTSQETLLATTLDWLAAFEDPTQSSFSCFIEEVNSLLVSPFDLVNWRKVEAYIAQLGSQESSVATSILGCLSYAQSSG